MAIRVSGTVSIAPTSGAITNPQSDGAIGGKNSPSTINQTGNTTVFTSVKTIISATNTVFPSIQNVGSIDHPGGDQQTDIDQGTYSTTLQRKLAGTYFAGGVGIEQDLSVGGFIYGRVAFSNTSTTSTNILVRSTNSGRHAIILTPYENVDKRSGSPLFANTTNQALVTQIASPGGLTYQPADGLLNAENLNVFSGKLSVSPVTGAFTVTGGVGIVGDINIKGNIYPGPLANTGTVGKFGLEWAEAYMNNIYTQFVGNTFTNLVLSPNNGVSVPSTGNGGTVDVFGEIRVRGNNPIGTAPVVTNVLYVTMDGNDTNDGRAMDPSRACRTVTGAVNSPYYQSGTQIRVSPGRYLEDNPILLKPYTSVMGSDIRTTGLEPINKTQDLFHVQSGCYIAFCQFLNGRSGLLPGNSYINGTNRGAYATAFPPLEGDARIDLFHSPYIQNCTNMSGPWLNDGEIFVPNQTVQIPFAVGTGSWVANTTTIVVNIANMPVNGFINAGPQGSSATQFTGELKSLLTFKGTLTNVNSLTNLVSPTLYDSYKTSDTGNIWVYTNATPLSLGQSVSSGQQNQSFFNARTLLLANKPFMQTQVVAYITKQISTATSGSIWYNFDYNQQLCYRDVGIITENIAYDVTFGGNEKSVEAGVAYWNGVVSYVAGQISQTVESLNYLKSLMQQVILNSTCTVITPVPTGIPINKQVINTVMTGGGIASSSINSATNIITNIIINGPTAAPAIYKSTGPDAAYASAEILLQANRKFIQEQTINYINYNLVGPRGPNYLPYNKIKCKRDTGLIIDSVADDLLFASPQLSQSTFAGLQYFSQSGYVGQIPREINTTTSAIRYLKQLAGKIVSNVTASQDAIVGITRYSNGTQITYIQPGTIDDVAFINGEFDTILEILGGKTTGWSDKIITNNGISSPFKSVQDAYALLQANRSYMQTEVLAYITSPSGLNYPATSFNTSTCVRDMGYIIDSVSFDLLYGGNKQAIQSGLSYYNVNGSSSVIPNEGLATVAAFNFLNSIMDVIITTNNYVPLQTRVKPITGLALSSGPLPTIDRAISTITNVIINGPANYSYTPIPLAVSTNTNVQNAYQIIKTNRNFLVAETIAYLDQTYNPGAFDYDQDLCYRDAGLMVDAVSQDIILGGNQRSIEAGLSYWNQGYNYVSQQLTTTTAAINYIADISKKIIANTTVTSITGTVSTQIINPYFQYGGDYMPQQAVTRNFGIITTIINQGPSFAPPKYAGGGLFSLTGLNGLDVKLSPKVTYINTITTGSTYLVGLDTATVGFGNNATLYFGDVLVFPYQDAEMEDISLKQTGSKSTWDSRKVDPIGGMGGSLVDGKVISSRSPIQSFVYDAFTQLTQGGHGVKITNDGYAQLVSVFTIFSSVGVQVDNGGIASIVNSNANFGDICLLAKGYGKRKFSGTVYNPPYRAYPFSPGKDGLDQYYPNGYWPYRGTMEVFIPDTANRPHISLIMEVVPPAGYSNLLNSPTLQQNGVFLTGFLNAQPSTSNLTTGSITLTGLDTTGVYVGNNIYVVDQFGFPYDNFRYMHDEFGNYVDNNGVITTNPANYVPNTSYKVWYCATGTVVTDVNYGGITLNQALPSGGGFLDNNTYFTVYATGNAYYTVQTSSIANDPYKINTNILSANTNTNYQGPLTSQITQHASSINYLNSLTLAVIANQTISKTTGNTATQYINTTLTSGTGTTAFVNLEFKNLVTIITATNINSALSVVPSNLIKQTGTIPAGAGSAVTLIQNNIEFLASEIYAWVAQTYPTILSGSSATLQQAKCRRDVALILQQLIYDLETGGNYNMVYAGLSYWGRAGTYHIIELGEAVNDPSLYPDGSTVNFYQRSYISASGYVFEYVGAGTNYGALPQVGRADPVQAKETVQLDGGKVFFTSTDQNGDFRIGPSLVISQATGVISGRTFTQSLFANMTPFILAIEAL
jgi:hypothetical protein